MHVDLYCNIYPEWFAVCFRATTLTLSSRRDLVYEVDEWMNKCC